MKIKSLILNLLLLLVVASGAYLLGAEGLGSAFTKTNTEKPVATKVAPDLAEIKSNITKRLQKVDESVTDILLEETPVSGVYWVLLPGNQMILMSADGRYVLGGRVSELTDKELVTVESNIQHKAAIDIKNLAIQGFEATQKNQIIFKAEGEKKGEIYVFTDIHCGYCKKFHRDVPSLNKAGIDVHYLAGPFFSKDRASLEKIWCSANPQEAMGMAKFQDKLESVSVTDDCKLVVTEHITLGEQLGIRGTPATYTKDGQQLGGYVPPEELIARITGDSQE